MVNFDNIIIESTGPIEMLLTKHTSLCMKIHCANKSGIHVELIVICFKKSCTPTQGASMGVRKNKIDSHEEQSSISFCRDHPDSWNKY